MTKALALARADGNDEEEVEVLAGLILLTSDRHDPSDTQHYIQQAEKKADKLKASAAKVIYLRAKAAAANANRDLSGAEKAYRAALDYCSTEPEDEKGNLAIQGCIVRSSFVHFLCNQKRLARGAPASSRVRGVRAPA